MPEPFVIVGAGQAAAKAVETLRGAGYDGALIVLGAEDHAPYQRPPLSKKYLAGEMSAAALALKAPDFYAAHGVELRLSASVHAIDTAARRLTLADGAQLSFGKLLIATGARPRTLPLPGAALPGVATLRTITDVDAIRARLSEARRVVVIGGGYIGLEVAAVARTHGHAVTVLEGRERVMSRVVAAPLSHHYEAMHRAHRVDIRTNVAIAAITGNDRATGVALAGGSTVAADFVLVSVGAKPNDELASAAGLTVNDGIVVDGGTRTSAPDIYAAGDCTRFPSRRYGRMVRLESVQNAIDQGRAAALAMLGEAQDYDPVPWFWSDQYDAKLQIAGLSEGYDRIAIEHSSETSFAVSYFAGERLLACDAVNAPRTYMLARRTLSGEEAAPRARARNP